MGQAFLPASALVGQAFLPASALVGQAFLPASALVGQAFLPASALVGQAFLRMPAPPPSLWPPFAGPGVGEPLKTESLQNGPARRQRIDQQVARAVGSGI